MGVWTKPLPQSTVKGLKYPSGRDSGLRTLHQWLDGKRQDDGAEGFWRIGDKLYDLESWAKNHPGGAEWIELTRGTDITEAFEVHHIMPTAEHLLPKFYVREATTPRSCPFTFAPDGFYRKLKTRVREALANVDIHGPSTSTKLIADGTCATALILCVLAAVSQSWILIAASGIFLAWTANIGHNFMHQRDNFRMYYMDLATQSSREWRVSHALSHHIFPNTVLDLEVSMFEPFLHWLPQRDKPLLPRLFSWLYSPIIYAIAFFAMGAKRIYSILVERNRLEITDAIPFLVPALMCLVVPPFVALVTWLKIIAACSFFFILIGVNAAHHHPDIFHDGDVGRADMDWGLLQMDAVRDRSDIDSSLFLVLTNFGNHCLHHLLPTVDHNYLDLCMPALVETCKEFNIDLGPWNQWELFKGQYVQLGKVTPTRVPNIRPNIATANGSINNNTAST